MSDYFEKIKQHRVILWNERTNSIHKVFYYDREDVAVQVAEYFAKDIPEWITIEVENPDGKILKHYAVDASGTVTQII